MKRAGWIASGVALFLLSFWLGVLVNFPGGALTRAVIQQLNALPGVAVTLEPLRMGLLGLRSSRMTVSEAGAPAGKPLLQLADLRIPVGLSLLRGLPLRASLGEGGRLAVFANWNGLEVVVDEFSAKLEDLAGLNPVPGITVRGQVTASGRIDLSPSARAGQQAQGSGGEFRAQGTAIQIAGIAVGGMALPEVRLDEVNLKLRTGRALQVEQLDVRGDAQGKATGAIVPMPGRVADSRVSLTVSGTIRGEWMQKAGAMQPIIEGFFPGGKVEGAVGGTLGNLSWIATGSRP